MGAVKMRPSNINWTYPFWWMQEGSQGGHSSHLVDPVGTLDTDCPLCARLLADPDVEFVEVR